MHMIFLGIDVSTNRQPFTFVALEGERRLLAIGEGELLEVLAFAAGQTLAIAAISAPGRPNQGRMKDGRVRNELQPPPPPGKYTNLRRAEYELERQGIPVPHTPSREENCPPWMRKAFVLYRNLEAIGYCQHPSEEPRQWLETLSEAGFISLLGQPLLPAATLEGRLQRQLILYEQDLPVSDPMRFFEEVTRFRLLHGNLPSGNILTAPELSAMMAAFTAWLAANHPERVSRYGDPLEGEVFLPARIFPEKKISQPESPFQNKAYPLPLIDEGVER
ncbi:MAG: DUF429 domain-containing protein [Anaerolineae bacterium]|nr:DUF429 domain-containing protein [Anaerolineae bacterium]